MTTKTTGMVALVTGGSTGLGLALSAGLARQGWQVITDGRSEEKFKGAALPEAVTVVVGDLTDADHRDRLRTEVERHGRLDLLVHNASTLGPLPMRPLAEVDIPDLMHVWRTNIGGPLVLTSALLPWLREADGVLLSISSDAAVQHYETWGLYGASKAALDHVTLTYAAETGLRAYAVDPGDMRTAMHQDAFPGEDISDRPLPETVVPRLLALVEARPESGRYAAADLGGVLG
ncbi:SDR family oxidoreductase [Nocardioides cavernae]|uniref:SDR family oxidoreductase n=1 Tax=Nocardioides cavernae TaxID=1921566 RepID=A0ABR8NB42_9ACTN|nr:SDR family oxidoreductase [Nocardioides cavernae]MBD3924405.1 SDR family oxidoreductase [Nocardioides cavernae]MBM7510649.1 NAD(P)-dependent dehydrogenase (short-subunit alcohol dehydrogenase family) [Nocardioides cavernae]